tara:strand:- start:226 stop:735 length:510 start_codon:yes stop_codon:yes gene_type:complete
MSIEISGGGDTLDLGDVEISFVDWTIQIASFDLEFSPFEPIEKDLDSPSFIQMMDFISEFIFHCECMKKLKTIPNDNPTLNEIIVELVFHENECPIISLCLLRSGKVHIDASARDSIFVGLTSIPSKESILKLLSLFYQIPLGSPEIELDTDGLFPLSHEFITHLENMK